MNETEARLWYERKLQALSDGLMDDLWANHKGFTDACLRTVAVRFPPFGGRWTIYDMGYPDRLSELMGALGALADTYLAGTREIALNYAYKSYLFGYFGNAWMVGGPVKQPMKQDVVMKMLAPWEGNDLAGWLAEAKIEFLRKARQALILSQSAVDKEGKLVGEDLAGAQARVRDTCGYPEDVVSGRVMESTLLEYNPNQPRDPAGMPTGGQWTDAPGGIPSLEKTSAEWANGLSSDDAESVSDYSLRSYKFIRASYERGEPSSQARRFINTIDNAPKVNGTVWRGIVIKGDRGAENAWADSMQRIVGTTIEWKAPASVTLKRAKSRTFGNCTFQIKSKSARYINALSYARSKFYSKDSNEYEAVFMPGTKFRVVRVKDNHKKLSVYDNSHDWWIYLEEV